MTYGDRLNHALTLAGKSRLQLAEKLGHQQRGPLRQEAESRQPRRSGCVFEGR